MSTGWIWALVLLGTLVKEVALPSVSTEQLFFPLLPWFVLALSLEKDSVLVSFGVILSSMLFLWFTPSPWSVALYPLLVVAVCWVLYRFFVSHRSFPATVLLLWLARLGWAVLWWYTSWSVTGEAREWLWWLVRILVCDALIVGSVLTVSQWVRRHLGRGGATLSSYESR